MCQSKHRHRATLFTGIPRNRPFTRLLRHAQDTVGPFLILNTRSPHGDKMTLERITGLLRHYCMCFVTFAIPNDSPVSIPKRVSFKSLQLSLLKCMVLCRKVHYINDSMFYWNKKLSNNVVEWSLLVIQLPRGDPGFKMIICSSYLHARRKRRLNWVWCRNHRTKDGPVL